MVKCACNRWSQLTSFLELTHCLSCSEYRMFIITNAIDDSNNKYVCTQIAFVHKIKRQNTSTK